MSNILLNLAKLQAFRDVSNHEGWEQPCKRVDEIVKFAGSNRAKMVRALWMLEGLGVALGKNGAYACWNDINPAFHPIMHVGLGVGIVQRVGFDPIALRKEIDRLSFTHSYSTWCHEGIGQMAAVQQARFMRLCVGLPIRTQKIGLPSLITRWMIGYGRVLMFSSWCVEKAMARARAVELYHTLFIRELYQGIGFATEMLSIYYPEATPKTSPVLMVGKVKAAQFFEDSWGLGV
jgi:hypothetical protein